MDSSFLKEQANRCRNLAENADPFIKKRLLDLARKYEAELGKPSAATRSLGMRDGQAEARSQDSP